MHQNSGGGLRDQSIRFVNIGDEVAVQQCEPSPIKMQRQDEEEKIEERHSSMNFEMEEVNNKEEARQPDPISSSAKPKGTARTRKINSAAKA